MAVATALGALAAIMVAVSRGTRLSQPRLAALMKVDVGGDPKTACMKETKSASVSSLIVMLVECDGC